MQSFDTFGEYLFYSYTKIDTLQHKNEEDIIITAVHEYVHAYLTKTTDYGAYLMYFFHVNKSNKNFKFMTEMEDRSNQSNQNQKYDKIFYKMNENMKEMQECVATLAELLFVAGRFGYKSMHNHLLNISEEYKKYILKYNKLLQESYSDTIYIEYMKYLYEVCPEAYQNFSVMSQPEAKITIMINLVIQIGRMALNIGEIECEVKNWESPNAMVNTILSAEKYHPNKRYKKIMDFIFREESTITPKCFDLSDYDYTLEAIDILHKIKQLNKDIYTKTLSKNIQVRREKVTSEIYQRVGEVPNRLDILEKDAYVDSNSYYSLR